jgi:3-phenylpropionate/cinnamic acid dioxygenase small subunit
MNATMLGLAQDIALQYEIEQFLYLEAALLDDRRFSEWLELLDPELEYWMPVRSTRSLGDEALEFAKLGEGAFFDDDKSSMEQRVAKLSTGYAWAEDPPSRTRHNVSNVRVLDRNAGLIRISCNFLMLRTRLANDNDLWSGRREDTLRPNDGSFTIVKRHLFVDHVSLDSKNLSSFF